MYIAGALDDCSWEPATSDSLHIHVYHHEKKTALARMLTTGYSGDPLGENK